MRTSLASAAGSILASLLQMAYTPPRARKERMGTLKRPSYMWRPIMRCSGSIVTTCTIKRALSKALVALAARVCSARALPHLANLARSARFVT